MRMRMRMMKMMMRMKMQRKRTRKVVGRTRETESEGVEHHRASSKEHATYTHSCNYVCDDT